MGQRLTDYALVAMVILVIFGLFRLSRLLMKSIMGRLQAGRGEFGPDLTLLSGFMFLLAGLIFLPSFTCVLALINNRYLVGGMILHLVLVALSIIMFSIAEDLFRDFPSIRGGEGMWTVSDHFRRILLPLLAFWLIGVLFLSPIFYSGLTIILAVFYRYALSCRKTADAGRSGEDGETSDKKD